MNYLFELSHPKHYYQFRIMIKELLANTSNNILVIARDKDVLLKVLKEDKISYVIYGKHGKSMFSKFLVLPRLFYTYYKILKKNKIDVVISKASPYAALLSKIYKVKTVITPDSEVVYITKKIVAPLATLIVTPVTYSLDYGYKHKRFRGFFEDCYLHPSIFTPDRNLVESLGFSFEKSFYILRFIGWNANHDASNFGFSKDEKLKLVNELIKWGNVYISSEGDLPSEIEKYRIKIPPSLVHHVIHFATMYIGDSQTMATESALLGTPAIRYNSFVGINDMTNFKVLEKDFKLLKNYNDFDSVIKCIDSFVNDSQNKTIWLQRQNEYYTKVGNVNSSILSFIEEI